MENLKLPIKRILISDTLDHTIVGLYEDTLVRPWKKMLVFKKEGVTLPGNTATNTSHTGNAEPVIGTDGLSTDLEVSLSTTDDGVKKGVLLEMSSVAPATDTNWGYSLGIRKLVKYPGVNNAQSNLYEKTYSGEKKRISVTSGVIADADLLAAEDDLITQIKNDTTSWPQETNEVIKFQGAEVNAYRAYKVTIDTSSASNIIITRDGVADPAITLALNTIDSAQAINADTTSNAYVRAWAISTTEIMVASRTNGYLFTVADGGGTGTLTVDNRYIMLEAKDVDVSFDAVIQDEQFTASSYTMVLTEDTDGTGTDTGIVNIGGTVYNVTGVTCSATQATYVAKWNTELVNAGIAATVAYASYDSYVTRGVLWGGSTVDAIKVIPGSTSSTTVYDTISYNSRFPSLTADEVFSVFANAKDGGKLASFQRLEQAASGTNWRKYTLKVKNIPFSDLHVPSGFGTITHHVEVYVKSGLHNVDKWDANADGRYSFMSGPGTADTTFDELLGIWSGLAVTSW